MTSSSSLTAQKLKKNRIELGVRAGVLIHPVRACTGNLSGPSVYH